MTSLPHTEWKLQVDKSYNILTGQTNSILAKTVIHDKKFVNHHQPFELAWKPKGNENNNFLNAAMMLL